MSADDRKMIIDILRQLDGLRRMLKELLDRP
jgi:hypothetical protein